MACYPTPLELLILLPSSDPPPPTTARLALCLVQSGPLVEPIDPEPFADALTRFADPTPVLVAGSLADKCRAGTSEGPARHSDFIADRCNQIKIIRDTRGLVSEPHWYAGHGVL